VTEVHAVEHADGQVDRPFGQPDGIERIELQGRFHSAWLGATA
jgi:hypothetical protein